MMTADNDGDTTTIVIFGASGDLTHRKLIPALFNQFVKGRLPEEFYVVGTSRSDISHEEYRKTLREGVLDLAGMECPEKEWSVFAKRVFYIQGNAKELSSYEKIDEFIREREVGSANRLYYLATAPFLFPVIVEKLGQADMVAEGHGWRRVVIEKPFGENLETAHELNETIHSVFEEGQIYRIDHYLGKETAQNILYFRFLNTIFEPIWNRNYISHVQITVAEEVDVGHRAGYYDDAGVVRDMFQNHLLQLLTLVAMEPPSAFNADAVRTEKVKVLRAIGKLDPSQSVRGQYQGYLEEDGVAEDSNTATYAALKLYIDNWRWNGVPFYLRSGKALKEKTSEIVIEFEPPPHVMFPLPEDYDLTPNFISLCIQPDEGIHLRFETKVPDSQQATQSVDMDFHFHESFSETPLPDAYERLLLDAIQGDPSLFTRSDEIETAWSIVDPLLNAWREDPDLSPVYEYEKGSWGPEQSDQFIERGGFIWRIGCEH
ncbi:MAG: glucose-6-phosphate dehydrogenase [Anaerolineales bacterium]|jgi:glucose-6-phosphate 1-dehydrogenase